MSEIDTAVVDRIVDGRTAVLLLEAEGTTVDDLAVSVAALPEAGRHEGAVFAVSIEDGVLRELTYRPDEERGRRERAQERFDRLSRRLPDEDS
ncbi:DUF3006 domain-containing protein [Halosolutus gelatinilyticus]|uniref:DUF3006 domain-containing protein n=1 Tax=Halosolutus gelatinilyticus TaxID=2931975 RepID=UPI001FF50F86|nr:DUF3006 domain-containing protein [Halosolutus gelatinilyticus]